MINLKQLSHLLALADERHFARAATKVHLSQPAFSRSIQAIERDVDMRLFERDAGDVRPTPGGIFLIERARQLLFDARCVERDMALYRESQLGDTAFGVGPFPASTLAQQLVAEVRRQYPRVGVRVEVNNWQNLLEHLRREDIEFFVADTRDIPASATLEIEPLVQHAGGLYVRRDHPLGKGTHSLQKVWDYGVAATKLPAAVHALLGHMLDLPAGESPKLALECDDVHLLIRTALDTDSVVAVTERAVQMHAPTDSLRRLRIQDFPPAFVEMGVVQLRQRTPSPMAQRVLDILRAQVRRA